MRILLVEDDESIREVFKMILEMEAPWPNFMIETAADGLEAISKILSQRMDLILLDLTLPEGHGFDLFKEIRNLKGGADVPVIAVTAHNLPEVREQALELGFAEYVTKPIDFENVLLPLIRRILDESARRGHAA